MNATTGGYSLSRAYSDVTIPHMIGMLVVAPNVPAETVMDLATSISTRLESAIETNGDYGVGEEKKSAVWSKELTELTAQLDSVHFWTIVKLSLSPVIIRAGSKVVDKVVDKLTDVAVAWAVKNVREGKKAKIQIYGADNKIIKEIKA